MSKETFKMFVRSNPSLLEHVKSGNMTWQRFYEMYDMYGENHSIWNSYIGSNISSTPAATSKATTLGDTPLKDVFNMVKKMDLETIRRGVDGLQKAVGLVQDLTTTKKTNNYQARPLYQHLED